jgi:hypothetical protein
MIQLIQNFIDSRRAAIASGYFPKPSHACDLFIFEQFADSLPVFSGWPRGAA